MTQDWAEDSSCYIALIPRLAEAALAAMLENLLEPRCDSKIIQTVVTPVTLIQKIYSGFRFRFYSQQYFWYNLGQFLHFRYNLFKSNLHFHWHSVLRTIKRSIWFYSTYWSSILGMALYSTEHPVYCLVYMWRIIWDFGWYLHIEIHICVQFERILTPRGKMPSTLPPTWYHLGVRFYPTPAPLFVQI